MTRTLVDIPSDSRTETDIRFMEDVLQRLREAAKAQGVAHLFKAHDAARGGSGVLFEDLFSRAEAPYDFQAFYHHYGIEWRNSRYGRDVDLSRAQGPGPQWVKFCTEDRLAWVRTVPALLQALESLPVSVSRCTSWRWDRTRPRPNGQATYVPVYEALVCVSSRSGASFQAATALPSLLETVCHAAHPLADAHLFDWQQDLLGRTLFQSYRWTRTGLEASFSEKAKLEEALSALFAGMATTVTVQGKGSDRTWTLAVTLPSLEHAAPLEA